MSFRIKINNVPNLKYSKNTHTKNCSISEGRLSGYNSTDDNFYTGNGYILWTDERNMYQPTYMHSVGPTINLNDQSLYRNKQTINSGSNAELSTGVSSSIDNIWGYDSVTVKIDNDTFSDGFYCLFAFPKGVL